MDLPSHNNHVNTQWLMANKSYSTVVYNNSVYHGAATVGENWIKATVKVRATLFEICFLLKYTSYLPIEELPSPRQKQCALHIFKIKRF